MESKNKRVAFLINGLPMGGAERVISTIANHLSKRGIDVKLITLKDSISAYRLEKAVEVVSANCNLNGGIINKLSNVLKVHSFYRKYISLTRPDVIIAFLIQPSFLAIIEKMLGLKYPLIVSERSDPFTRKKSLQRICNILYAHANCIVCQGDRVKKYYRQIGAKYSCEVIPNPINDECVADYVAENREKRIIAVGRLSSEKNHQLLIEGFATIAQRFPKHRVEIYGKGPLQEKLQKRIDELGMSDKIFLMGTRSNLMKELHDSCLFVMPSNNEGFPNALIEAMASGIPVICTDFPTGIAREVIQDGENGFVIPVMDKDALIDRMIRILSQPELQKLFGKNARMIRDQFNIDKITNKWETVFDIAINLNTGNKHKGNNENLGRPPLKSKIEKRIG